MRFPLKTALAVALSLTVLAAVHWWKPELGLSPRVLVDAWRLGKAHKPASGSTAAAPVMPPAAPQAPGQAPPRPPLAEFLFDDGGSLDSLFQALARLETPGATGHVAILHYGDSPTTADLITGDVRALLQQRFGDAGHGYLLVGKPWAWYGHRDTDIADHDWTIGTAVGKGHADTYGLGGASFQGGPGAASHITLKDAAQTGMELSFLAQPEGGTVAVAAIAADGAPQALASVNTAGEAREPKWQTLALPAGTKAVDLKTANGHVELFGENFTRTQPGILYDSLGLNGASTTVLSRGFNPDVWTAELRHEAPALVIINYGTNESSSAAFVDKQYEGELRRAIDRIRTALPDVSILVMSPMDRGERHGIDGIETMATIPRIVAVQKRVAADTHCAFFDTFDAMGGDGTMSRWYTGRPRMVAADLIHPTPQGASIIAQIFVKNLMQGYDSYRAHRGETRVAGTQTAAGSVQAATQ